MAAEAIGNSLTNKLPEVEAEALGDTLSDVQCKALVDTLAAELEEAGG